MDRYRQGYDFDYDRIYGSGRRRPGFRYDRDRFGRGPQGYARDYDRYGPRRQGFRSDPWGADRIGYRGRYDDGYGYESYRKSRWQTDYGDPFGDRQRHTPMRVIRGEPHWANRGRWSGDYARDYQAWGFPQHYEPYAPRAGFHID
jgi:hypothetical protein